MRPNFGTVIMHATQKQNPIEMMCKRRTDGPNNTRRYRMCAQEANGIRIAVSLTYKKMVGGQMEGCIARDI